MCARCLPVISSCRDEQCHCSHIDRRLCTRSIEHLQPNMHLNYHANRSKSIPYPSNQTRPTPLATLIAIMPSKNPAHHLQPRDILPKPSHSIKVHPSLQPTSERAAARGECRKYRNELLRLDLPVDLHIQVLVGLQCADRVRGVFDSGFPKKR